MSRGVKDLRELICVSRLTVCDSDDDYNASDASIDEAEGDDRSTASTRLDNLDGRVMRTSVSRRNMITPDSGFSSNGTKPNSASSDIASMRDAVRSHRGSFPADHPNLDNLRSESAKQRQRKKKKPKLPLQSYTHDLPRLSPLPPVPAGQKNAAVADVQRHEIVTSLQDPERASTPGSALHAAGQYDDMLMFMDANVVSEWLELANDSVTVLSIWCRNVDNFVRFAHFWLSDFEERAKRDIIRLEHGIFVDQLTFAFAPGCDAGKVRQRDISAFTSAVFREYPTRLLDGSKMAAHLFLDHLDVLSATERRDAYRLLLSDVKCSTRVPQHAQWILATRSFALISVWSAVVNFYRNLELNTSDCADGRKSRGIASRNSMHDDDEELIDAATTNRKRIYQAIRLGYVDVVHYLLHSGKVSPDVHDENHKSLLFYSVVYNQPKVLRFLLTKLRRASDVNEPASNGNTPLHAAANSGNGLLVSELLSASAISVDMRNTQCEDATPLHLAIMHGHRDVVRLLLDAGADVQLKMGSLSSTDIARDFGHDDILHLLQEDQTDD